MLLLLSSCLPPAVGWRDPAPELRVDTEMLAFDDVPVGTTAALPLRLQNTGDAATTLTLQADAPFGVAGDALELGAGATVEIEVSYRPTDYDGDDGALRIVSGAPFRVVSLTGAATPDSDADGHVAVEAGGDDCDDTDPETRPGAAETCYDGVDDDCDGAADADCDGDGWPVDADCDDTDPDVSPGAVEAAAGGVDDDCDGQVDETARGHGDVYMSELHPGGSPWIELCSGATVDVALDGLRVATRAGAHTLAAASLVPGSCVAVCASPADACPLVAEGLVVDGADDLVQLVADATVLDAVALAGWAYEVGGTWSLDVGLGAADNNDPAAWCLTDGSPGSPNPACP